MILSGRMGQQQGLHRNIKRQILKKIFILKTKIMTRPAVNYLHGRIFKKCKLKFVQIMITEGRMRPDIGKGVNFNIKNKLDCFQKLKCF